MQKIGIITHYYNSINYGGCLQAYALCQYMRELGYRAEQICFQTTDRTDARSVKCKMLIARWIRLLNPRMRKQSSAIQAFRNLEIPHSKAVYTEKSIENCKDYDVYVTGSDQVWNFSFYQPAYFLNFVPAGKTKIAYAASMGRNVLTENQKELLQNHLRDFTAISVRERDAVDFIAPLSPVPVQWLPDPVLLLTRRQWDAVCSERLVKEPYLFCYFLGKEERPRQLALAFAKQKNLKVASIAYVRGTPRKCDRNFGDIQLFGIPPQAFVSLIKNAAYVFTDSFHATAFSELYDTAYAVFCRDGTDDMTSRLYSITSLFGNQQRFCDSPEKETLHYLDSLPLLERNRTVPELEAMRRAAHSFWEENLNTSGAR